MYARVLNIGANALSPHSPQRSVQNRGGGGGLRAYSIISIFYTL